LLPNAKTIYEVPLTIEKRGIGDVLTERLALGKLKPDMKEWQALVEKATDYDAPIVKVGVVAKYLNNEDTYMSVFEALGSAGWSLGRKVDLYWIDAEKITEKNVVKTLSDVDGIVVPGGFGERGVEGMIIAAQHALKTKMPYLGICLGLQVAVIAAARNAGLKDAHTTEINPKTTHPVISTMADQKGKEATGGTMRLGNYECHIEKKTKAHEIYGTEIVQERHRHRYECNNEYRDNYVKWGIKISGLSPDKKLVEMIEALTIRFSYALNHTQNLTRGQTNHIHFLKGS
jgi:CTP synthase